MKDAVTTAINTQGTSLKDAANAIQSAISQGVTDINGATQTFQAAITASFADLGQNVNGVKEKVGELKEALNTQLTNVVSKQDAVKTAIDAITDNANTNSLTSMLTAIKQMFSTGLADQKVALNGIKDAIQNSNANLSTQLSAIKSAIDDSKLQLEAIKTAVETSNASLLEKIETVATAIDDQTQQEAAIAYMIADGFTAWTAKLNALVAAVQANKLDVDVMKNAITEAINAVSLDKTGQWIQTNVMTPLNQKISELMTNSGSANAEIINALKEIANNTKPVAP